MQETNRRLTDADLNAFQNSIEYVLTQQRVALGKEQYLRMDLLRDVLIRIDNKLERMVGLLAAATGRK